MHYEFTFSLHSAVTHKMEEWVSAVGAVSAVSAVGAVGAVSAVGACGEVY